MTTDPSASPPRIRSRIGVFVGIIVILIFAEWYFFDTGRYAVSGSEKLAISPIENIFGLLFVVVSGFFGYVFAMGMKQRLIISGSHIDWDTKLPRWLASGSTNWRLERKEIRRVIIDLRAVSLNPLRAKIDFDCGDTRKSLRLFGWHRKGLQNETYVKPKRGFIRTDWESEARKLPLVRALEEAGFTPIVVTE